MTEVPPSPRVNRAEALRLLHKYVSEQSDETIAVPRGRSAIGASVVVSVLKSNGRTGDHTRRLTRAVKPPYVDSMTVSALPVVILGTNETVQGDSPSSNGALPAVVLQLADNC